MYGAEPRGRKGRHEAGGLVGRQILAGRDLGRSADRPACRQGAGAQPARVLPQPAGPTCRTCSEDGSMEMMAERPGVEASAAGVGAALAPAACRRPGGRLGMHGGPAPHPTYWRLQPTSQSTRHCGVTQGCVGGPRQPGKPRQWRRCLQACLQPVDCLLVAVTHYEPVPCAQQARCHGCAHNREEVVVKGKTKGPPLVPWRCGPGKPR